MKRGVLGGIEVKEKGNVTQFPVRKVYPPVVGAREMYDQAEPTDEMVWAVCPWLRTHRDESRCHRCPQWEEDETYGPVQRGCYALASEACRIVFAMLNREGQG